MSAWTFSLLCGGDGCPINDGMYSVNEIGGGLAARDVACGASCPRAGALETGAVMASSAEIGEVPPGNLPVGRDD